jgi:hypothetical protein
MSQNLANLWMEFLLSTFAKMKPFQNIKALESHVTRWDMHLWFVCLALYSFCWGLTENRRSGSQKKEKLHEGGHFAKMKPFQNIKALESHVTRWYMHLWFVCLGLYSLFWGLTENRRSGNSVETRHSIWHVCSNVGENAGAAVTQRYNTWLTSTNVAPAPPSPPQSISPFSSDAEKLVQSCVLRRRVLCVRCKHMFYAGGGPSPSTPVSGPGRKGQQEGMVFAGFISQF